MALNQNQQRFRDVLEIAESQWLEDLWVFESARPSFRLETFERLKTEGMPDYEVAAVEFFRSVWTGFTDAHIDLKDLAKNDRPMRRAIAAWVADPFWP